MSQTRALWNLLSGVGRQTLNRLIYSIVLNAGERERMVREFQDGEKTHTFIQAQEVLSEVQISIIYHVFFLTFQKLLSCGYADI